MLNQLYLIRHGQPQPGGSLPYDRPPGPPLSQQGRDEARDAARYLHSVCAQSVRAPICIERMFVSPLDRTLETARELAPLLGLGFEVEPALAEHRSDESFDQVKRRVRDWLATLMGDSITCAAIVTHGSPIRAALQLLSHDAIDLSKHQYPNGNPAPTAGIWSATRNGDDWELALVFDPQLLAQAV